MGYEEQQLELFQPSERRAHSGHVHSGRPFAFRLRHDQAMLLGIGTLIGVAVIFACGVERGKQLARSERLLLARDLPSTLSAPVEPPKAAVQAPSTPKTKSNSPRPTGNNGTTKSRYAVQVVTYTRPQLAKKELQRLQARGEPAFLMIREGRTTLYVGPFPSKSHASEKLSSLRTRYQDCFVKTL